MLVQILIVPDCVVNGTIEPIKNKQYQKMQCASSLQIDAFHNSDKRRKQYFRQVVHLNVDKFKDS